MFHKVNSVMPLADMCLLIHFSDGTAKKYDVQPLADRFEAFRALKTVPGLFPTVKADKGGYGISWNDDMDISCDELWENGVDVPAP